MRRSLAILLATCLLSIVLAAPASAEPPAADPPVDAECSTDLDTSDGDAHAACVAVPDGAECMHVIWGAGAGPVFVGGAHTCQAGVFYDEGR